MMMMIVMIVMVKSFLENQKLKIIKHNDDGEKFFEK